MAKMKNETLAAIDIGSNAIRLLIKYIESYTSETEFKKAAYIRVPIRLGEDVFTEGKVLETKRKLTVEAMEGFAHLMKAYRVDHYRACATSAMREAANGKELIKLIKKAAGIKIEIISGTEEAGLIYKAGKFDSFIDPDKSYVYMDVGGGSTEIIVYSDHKAVSSRSFRLGTVRILSKGVDKAEAREFAAHLEKIRMEYSPAAIIGSGGNINKVQNLLRKKSSDRVNVTQLEGLYKSLASMDYLERMERAGLNSYRADVILPALNLFLTAANKSGVAYIIIPKVGLTDGIIRQLYEDGM
ncbi:MAG: hypothetical protein LIO77_01585 [Rikenellaceae bacterium]|nr:hypothetical protein [Rikenellaceae bacterium]